MDDMNVKSEEARDQLHLVCVLHIVPTLNEEYPASAYYFH